jgi:chromosome segregation ATPase
MSASRANSNAFESMLREVITGDLPPYWLVAPDLVPNDFVELRLEAIRKRTANISVLFFSQLNNTAFNYCFDNLLPEWNIETLILEQIERDVIAGFTKRLKSGALKTIIISNLSDDATAHLFNYYLLWLSEGCNLTIYCDQNISRAWQAMFANAKNPKFQDSFAENFHQHNTTKLALYQQKNEELIHQVALLTNTPSASEMASQYFAINAEMEKLQIQLIAVDSAHLAKITELQEHLKQLLKFVPAVQTDIGYLREENTAHKTKIEILEHTIAEQESNLAKANLNSELEKKLNKKQKNLDAKTVELANKTKALASQQADAEQTVVAEQEKLAAKAKELAEISNEFDSLKAEADELYEEHKATLAKLAEAEEKVVDEQQKNADLIEKQTADLLSKLPADVEIEQLKKQLGIQSKEINAMDDSRKLLNRKKKRREEEVDELTQQLGTVKHKYDKLADSYAILYRSKKVAKTSSDINTSDQPTLTALNNEITQLKAISQTEQDANKILQIALTKSKKELSELELALADKIQALSTNGIRNRKLIESIAANKKQITDLTQALTDATNTNSTQAATIVNLQATITRLNATIAAADEIKATEIQVLKQSFRDTMDTLRDVQLIPHYSGYDFTHADTNHTLFSSSGVESKPKTTPQLIADDASNDIPGFNLNC